jgi:two-component system C4-dicarboxylate transport response regulator DctD
MGCETTSNVSAPHVTRHILLVDDDTALLTILPETIEFRIAYVTVTACDSAEAALKHLDTRDYDLLITDLNMPGIKGLELVRKVKSVFPEMAVLIMTGHGDDRIEAQARAAGVNAFIRKPCDPHGLVTEIERALEPSPP